MASISAADVKKLRDTTGAGMMDAKKALEEADGDFDKAVEILRVKGGAKVQKRDGERNASNGLIAAAEGAMIELACETDFVAKGEDLQTLAGDIVAHLAGSAEHEASAGAADPIGLAQKLLGETLKDGRTVAENIEAVAARIGEKLELRRAVKLSGQVATYLHTKAPDLPPQVGVLVQYAGSDLAAARGAAMQIAAMRPRYLQREDVPAESSTTSGASSRRRPAKRASPRRRCPRSSRAWSTASSRTTCCSSRRAVQDNKKTVKALLDEAGVTVTGFAHFEIG